MNAGVRASPWRVLNLPTLPTPVGGGFITKLSPLRNSNICIAYLLILHEVLALPLPNRTKKNIYLEKPNLRA
jgi:hypothetical protein